MIYVLVSRRRNAEGLQFYSLMQALALTCYHTAMATDPTPAPDGILIEPDAPPAPRKGERADMIRHLYERNPRTPRAVIARKVGCTEGNVSQVLKSYLQGITPDELSDFRENKPAIFEALQHRTLASITAEDITKASYMQRVTGAAILQDKVSLMRGQPTSIHVHALVDVLDALRRRDQE